MFFRPKKQIFFVLKVTEAILVGFCSNKLDVLRGSDDSIMTSRSLWLLERGRLSHGSDDSITRFPARAVGDPQRPRDFSRPWSLAPRGPESLLVRREKSRIGHGGEGPPADAENLTPPALPPGK